MVKARIAVKDLTDAQQACDDYGSIVQTVVGTEGYETLLKQLLSAVETHQPGERSKKKVSQNSSLMVIDSCCDALDVYVVNPPGL